MVAVTTTSYPPFAVDLIAEMTCEIVETQELGGTLHKQFGKGKRDVTTPATGKRVHVCIIHHRACSRIAEVQNQRLGVSMTHGLGLKKGNFYDKTIDTPGGFYRA